jgi:benzoate membrane transport protein
MIRYFKDVSVAAFSAGFVAVLVGFTSSVAIVFQAAMAFGATPAQLASWMWALGLGMGLCTAIPSLILRKPVMVAWSTPGAAVLASTGVAATAAGAGFDMADAVGAFMVSAALIALFGITGWFERLMDKIPMAIAQALLAGVLARFALQAFQAAQTALGLVLVMLAVYLAGKRLWARYAVPVTLLSAIGYIALFDRQAWTIGQMAGFSGLTMPVFVMPAFSLSATMSLALPLFIVTMASQNLPGVAAIRASGYQLPLSKIITMTGLATLVFAPFGGFALNLSAITAAMVMGKEASEDATKRYTAAVSCGLIYIAIGLFGAAVAGVLQAFPKEMIAAIAGLALLGTIGNSLAGALADERNREAALITFFVTLSGVSIGGIGSAFWAVVVGLIAMVVLRPRAV